MLPRHFCHLLCAISLASATAPAATRLPLVFEANRGQAGSGVRFLARGSGSSLAVANRQSRDASILLNQN